ncbi:TPA: ACP S-malonyltransferase [Salmonella enterica subsp. enterica serovar Typhimurium var. 5-]|uniref:Malonyl CoA-acyl carrier protein transacylase n=1 Tax=Salmonella enterica subsp. enterica serovar Typhimurium var. 5- TaxID=1620419 RepID=A0A740PMJ5_SALTM|nr:ACP S-malonyltransferase [Salmonella enterica subsp. enterica serovar Typhimurium var. 5-]
MGKIAFLFPGQGSQTVGMGQALALSNESVSSTFKKADEVLGESLSSLIFEGPQEKLTLTTNAQPALLTTSIAILNFFNQYGIKPDYTAGHSLGEYSALVASGAITFEDAVYAVRKRGEYMEEAVPNGEGTMAAVLGMDREKLMDVTETVTAEGNPVQLANLNCPGQIVISGSKKGVEEASVKAKEAGAKRVIPLDVSGPFHSSLMKPAAERFEAILNGMSLKDADIPVIGNVTAEPMTEAGEIKKRLIEQLYSPVLWEDTVGKMLELGVDTFIEIGPGKVLSGLVKKVDRSAKTYAIYDAETCEAAITALKGETK